MDASWDESWACPEPPQPAEQESLLDWSWDESWVVSAVFVAEESAELSRLCEAELGGSANETGLLAFVPDCVAVPSDVAS
jgi:hypothetical protein